jgi:hypothetical protein
MSLLHPIIPAAKKLCMIPMTSLLDDGSAAPTERKPNSRTEQTEATLTLLA